MPEFVVRLCEGCSRNFIPSGCPEHCGPECCRRQVCSNAPAPSRRPGAKTRTCVVCGRSNERFPFERFAECDAGCSRLRLSGRQGLTATRVRVWYCEGVLATMNQATFHHPSRHKPRIHVRYCSLRCWASPTYGHEARARKTANDRHARYWHRHAADRNTYLAERRRQKASGTGSGTGPSLIV